MNNFKKSYSIYMKTSHGRKYLMSFVRNLCQKNIENNCKITARKVNVLNRNGRNISFSQKIGEMKTVPDDILRTWSKYAKTYDPIKCASIDGTDIEPHDRAVVRALNSTYKPNRFVKGRPECTIFVSRLNHETSKDTIKDIFSKYGKLKRFRMVKDIVTGMPKGYAFVEYEEEQAAEDAYRLANKMVVDGHVIFVDFECERLLKGWKPRRLGGGFGGKKESGQLRFGGRDRPFKKPIALEMKEQEERRRREKERRGLEEERRRKDRRKSPIRENGFPSKSKKTPDSRDRAKHSSSPRSGSPPRKMARHHSPPKQVDKTSQSRHSDNTKAKSPPCGETKVNSPSRTKDGKRSHLQEKKHTNSSPQNDKSKPCPKENDDKYSAREQTQPKSSTKEHVRQKSPITEQAKQRSSPARGKSKQIQTSNTSKVKHPTENRHSSPPRQNGRTQISPERYKRSPPRNPYRSRSSLEKNPKYSPERGSDKMRSPVPKYEKRPTHAREKRRSISPHHGNVQYKSVARGDDRRNQNFRGESPHEKLERYHYDKRHSPIQSFSEHYSPGRDRVPVSASKIDKYSPVNRAYQPHHVNNDRRSPARRYSPSRTDKSFRPSSAENLRAHYNDSSQRHTRDDSFAHDRKRDPGSVDLYPKEHRPYSPLHRSGRLSPYGGYIDHLPPRGYQEYFEYNNRSHYSSTKREGDFSSSHTELRRYSPSRVDLLQPPPSYETPRDYTSYRDNMALSRSRDLVPSKETSHYSDFHPDIERYAPKALHASRYPIPRDNTGEHQRHFSPEPQHKRQYISPNRSPRRGASRGGKGRFRRN